MMTSAAVLFGSSSAIFAQSNSSLAKENTMKLSQDWDKIFPLSDKVEHQKVTFTNRYGLTLAGDLYLPKNRSSSPLPAIAVSGPFGAVKEQSSGIYAQTMAERGFVTMAFDPSYTGESSGEPRNIASPDINTEDFSAAVDYLGMQSFVDKDRIGIIGICGLAGLLDHPDDVDFLAPMILRELIYRLLRGNQSARLSQSISGAGNTHRIGQAIQHIRQNIDQSLRIEELARQLGMSVSSFHQHFKTVTAQELMITMSSSPAARASSSMAWVS
jgi:hypothetical protein